ncbi:DUF1648 domain-containing protein [Ralstonia pickettii]|nr:DUF1648 domain-containing protein [Ralstonia pickettii]
MWRNIHKYYSPWIDMLTFGMLIGSFLYVIFSFGSLPAEIPVHFNLAGEADRWGNKGALIGLMVLHFYTVMICFLLNYFLIIRSGDTTDSLQFINIPFIKKDELTVEQIQIVKRNTARMLAGINLLVSILFAVIYDEMIQKGLGENSVLSSAVGIIIIAVFLPIIYYSWKIYTDIKRNRA